MTGELKIPRFTVGRVLNHLESGVTGVYDRYAYDDEKRDALARWDQLVRCFIPSPNTRAAFPTRPVNLDRYGNLRVDQGNVRPIPRAAESASTSEWPSNSWTVRMS